MPNYIETIRIGWFLFCILVLRDKIAISFLSFSFNDAHGAANGSESF